MLERYPNEVVHVNISGTLNVVEAALLNQVEQFVLISTDKAVDPSSVMGVSKRICELIVHGVTQTHNHKTQFTTVRSDMTRYFMSISEATNPVIHASAMTEGDDVFVLLSE
jgi:FlaA1/EpsC-like NDP-sugar epimerase